MSSPCECKTGQPKRGERRCALGAQMVYRPVDARVGAQHARSSGPPPRLMGGARFKTRRSRFAFAGGRARNHAGEPHGRWPSAAIERYRGGFRRQREKRVREFETSHCAHSDLSILAPAVFRLYKKEELGSFRQDDPIAFYHRIVMLFNGEDRSVGAVDPDVRDPALHRFEKGQARRTGAEQRRRSGFGQCEQHHVEAEEPPRRGEIVQGIQRD